MAAQVQSLPARSSLLRRALQADAVVSGLSGIACFADAGWLTAQLGITSAAVYALGAIMLGYAAALGVVSRRDPVDRRAGIAAVVLNADWVIASVAILATGWLPLTSAGWWLVAIQAAVVAVLAEAQFVGLRRR